ncbi:uncharacterized protein LOC131891486 [Tigriopus californicus]|uniref:uncharacterized protein LOC131891486 n=1 Tax=Tigriopus californicus TaxID=6832 RepID=UPI0027DAA2C6|nr:uncharacterized protein LOC131891486 [Tigriopus californicus]
MAPSPRRAESNILGVGTRELVLSVITLILGAINISVIGYNFSYYKGTWRNNLFHSELAFLIIFSSSFILTSSLVIADFFSLPQSRVHAVNHLVGNIICGILSAIASLTLVIQLCSYGRFLVNAYELKMISASLGLLQSGLNLLTAGAVYPSLANP